MAKDPLALQPRKGCAALPGCVFVSSAQSCAEPLPGGEQSSPAVLQEVGTSHKGNV